MFLYGFVRTIFEDAYERIEGHESDNKQRKNSTESRKIRILRDADNLGRVWRYPGFTLPLPNVRGANDTVPGEGIEPADI